MLIRAQCAPPLDKHGRLGNISAFPLFMSVWMDVYVCVCVCYRLFNQEQESDSHKVELRTVNIYQSGELTDARPLQCGARGKLICLVTVHKL